MMQRGISKSVVEIIRARLDSLATGTWDERSFFFVFWYFIWQLQGSRSPFYMREMGTVLAWLTKFT